MAKFKGFIQITRPVNVLVCALSVFSGGLLAEKPFERLCDFFPSLEIGLDSWAARLLCAAVSASLILAAGNVFNDVCDLDTDRINTPHRPLPAKILTRTDAVVFAALLAFIGLLLAVPLGVTETVIALSCVVILFFYDLTLKRVPLAGNFAVAFLGGLAFIYGGIAGFSPLQSIVPALFAFLFHLGRELVKDVADISGDSLSGIRTAATAWGAKTALVLSGIVFAVLAVFVLLPAVVLWFGRGYLAIIAIGVWPVLIYVVVSSLSNPSQDNLQRLARLLKLDMPIGIIAVLAGFQGW
ncbi:MAG: geranylgeranylglycerol-phosphate geranylgeranyltransferase [Candidatus Latescibacterota bacterium]